MNSEVYFETQVGLALDQLLPIFPIASILYLLFKFPELTKHISELLKTRISKVLSGFSLLTCAVVLYSTFNYFEVASLRAVIDEKRYDVVSGCVKNYNSESSPTKYRMERFSIENIEFEFSNFTQSRYFTGDDHIDNFIKNEECMEISYIKDGGKNNILKIVRLARK
ncbi:hypothetical protein [Pseudoalteromonas xiamenensis]